MIRDAAWKMNDFCDKLPRGKQRGITDSEGSFMSQQAAGN